VNLAHQFFVRQQELSKVHGVRVLDHRHQQVAGSIALLNVYGQSQSNVLVTPHSGGALLIYHVDKGGVERGYSTQSLDHGKGD
jgi:hypothetical protein